ncbi:glycosyltransferase family 4 protein [Primorskyibacter aestuariivivens]|uniref:glycosyltransferase family 4 protein n=1 Tax=Primorskyibacter aestuariivivens TaxID=1888912 RepID=UPI002301199D|nr:glycosyltransferase family 4 protein [Primorskyibacter aestuariivivens]MDA7427751.1 glycosyltransferase family 4 protein [Primorskyibacter aestuariivivens]
MGAHVGDVTVLDPGWGRLDWLRRAIDAMPEAIMLRLRWRIHLLLARFIAHSIQKQLVQGRFDVVFGAYSFHSMAGLRVPPGMLTAYTSDATPTTYKRSEIGESFGSYLALSRLFDPMILRAERKTFSRIDFLLWPTEWLKSGADGLYDLSDVQSLVVPWGANVPDPMPSDVPPVLSAGAPVRLVLVGRDWFAKGGPLVFETIKVLRNRGIDAQIDVIGVEPPEFNRADFVKVHGLLDKADPEQFARFESVLRRAHFLFQPSFESFGFAFCEASAYGLPSLCLRVGGVPVRDGVNGYALPRESTASDFADKVAELIAAPDAYRKLRASSRTEYEERLNWDAWGRRVDALLAERGQ